MPLSGRLNAIVRHDLDANKARLAAVNPNGRGDRRERQVLELAQLA